MMISGMHSRNWHMIASATPCVCAGATGVGPARGAEEDLQLQ